MSSIIIHAVIFAVMSSIFIVAGLRGLIAKRPFVVSQRWQAVMIILGLAPAMMNAVEVGWPKYPGESRLNMVLFIVLLAMLFGTLLLSLRGYLVFGATRPALRAALHYALGRLNLPYEESAQTYRLPTINTKLLAEATAIDGVFQINLKKWGNHRTVRRLAAEINGFFKTMPAPPKPRESYGLIAIGSALLLLGSWVTYSRLSIHAELRALEKPRQESLNR